MMLNSLNSVVMSKMTGETSRMQFPDQIFSHRRARDA